MPHNPQISLRPGTDADIPLLVSLGLAAFGRDDIIAQTLFPPSHEPDAAKRREGEAGWRANRMRRDMKNPQMAHIVAYVVHDEERGTEDDDTAWRTEVPEEQIVGFAVWEMPEDVTSMLELVDDSTGSTSTDTVDPDKTIGAPQDQQSPFPAPLDTNAFEMLNRISDEGAKSVLGDEGTSNMWTLIVIAVDPEHRRRGVGTMLVTWGIEKARQAGKDIYLASMPVGRSLYLSCGFREAGEMDVFGVTQYHMLLRVSDRI